jgi:hypothetical protein
MSVFTTPTVRISFDLDAAGIGQFFTIGDNTKGVLGASAFPLIGPTPVDVTEYVRSINIRRGRSRETDYIDAGRCTVVLDNRRRLFDPANRTPGFVFNQPNVLFDDPQWTFNDFGFGSPFAESLVPRKQVTVDVGGRFIFFGQIEDYDLTDQIDGDNTTTLLSSDGFTLLAAREVSASPSSASVSSGDRITEILNDPGVAWPPARREIDPGQVTVGGNPVPENQNALRYLQEVAGSDPGIVFVSRRGAVTFRDRLSLQRDSGIMFSDTGSGIPFQSISREVGTEQLFNDIKINYFSGSVAEVVTASNLDSQEKYGIEVLNYKTFLSGSVQAEDLALFYSRQFNEPTNRIDGLQVFVNSLDFDDQIRMFRLELGDLVRIEYTPAGWGDPIEQASRVEAIEHQITPTQHIMRLNLSTGLAGFLIGESLLGEETIGF